MLTFSELCPFLRVRAAELGIKTSGRDALARMNTKTFALLLSGLIAATVVGSSPLALAAKVAPEPVPIIPRLFAVPVLEPGKPAWVSVYDQYGKPVPDAVLSLNGSTVQADNMGQASFTVPIAATLTMGVQQDGKLLSPSEYTLTPGGWLVAEKQAQEAVDRIEESVVSNEQSPTIAYAPTVVETSQPFVLMGKNWSGKADGDQILVDGYDADVFSGSTVSLLATTPRRMSLGPLREMYVTTGSETSNTVEVDVCRVDTSIDEASTKIRVIGSNVPALVELRNLSPEAATLHFGKYKLGRRSALITSGGENNLVNLTVTPNANASTQAVDLDTHLIADAPWSPDDRATFDDNNKKKLIAELNKSEIVRLKRRLIAIEQRIGEERERRAKGLANTELTKADIDHINAQLRSLSNRQRRINATVVARRAVFQALGGTEEEYRSALAEAAGGGAIALEKTLAPIASAALLASTNAAQAKANKDHASVAAAIDDAINIDRKKEMEQLAEFTRMWKTMPTKVAHNTRLAPPPPPYIPDFARMKRTDGSIDYTAMLKLGAPPPPPPLVALIKQQQRRNAAHHHSTKASLSRKSSRQKSKSQHR